MNDISNRRIARRFWAYAQRYQRWMKVAFAGNLLTVGVALSTPLLIKFVIDEAIPGRNMGLLLGLVALFLLMSVTRQVVAYGHYFLQNYVGRQVVFDIRKSVFHHLQVLHLSFYEQERTASLVT